MWTHCYASHIFVNRIYDIICIPDFEWISILPLEALSPPFWLSGYAIDDLEDEEEKKHYHEMGMELLDPSR